ncbi:MAG: hypothetical protein OXF20_05435 [Gammaproteobacteria bacterium]|nr:hypothetical protein [Gammaproteobacteria bacterium]
MTSERENVFRNLGDYLDAGFKYSKAVITGCLIMMLDDNGAYAGH